MSAAAVASGEGAAARVMAWGAAAVIANAAAVVWFGASAYETMTHGEVLAEAMRSHRFLSVAAVDGLVPAVGGLQAAVALMGVVGVCSRSMRPLGPLAVMAGLVVFTGYLAGVWAWGDASAGCGCTGRAGMTVPAAVLKNAVAGAAAFGAFWASLPARAPRGR